MAPFVSSWFDELAPAAGLALPDNFEFSQSMFFLLNLRQFAKFYTLGTLSIISSMLFLVGPARLFKSMFDSSRLVASIAYVGSMVLTLYAAIVIQSWILAFICVVFQICASLWYGSSFVPFAQTLLRSTASSLLPI